MTGNAPDIGAFAAIATEHDALLYLDDAHGFGVIGERAPGELCDYGTKGNSLIRHQGITYDNVVMVAGFSKSYSSLLAFLALPTRLKDALKVLAPPYCTRAPRRSLRLPRRSPGSRSTAPVEISLDWLCGRERIGSWTRSTS